MHPQKFRDPRAETMSYHRSVSASDPQTFESTRVPRIARSRMKRSISPTNVVLLLMHTSLFRHWVAASFVKTTSAAAPCSAPMARASLALGSHSAPPATYPKLFFSRKVGQTTGPSQHKSQGLR